MAEQLLKVIKVIADVRLVGSVLVLVLMKTDQEKDMRLVVMSHCSLSMGCSYFIMFTFAQINWCGVP